MSSDFGFVGPFGRLVGVASDSAGDKPDAEPLPVPPRKGGGWDFRWKEGGGAAWVGRESGF